MQGELWVRDVRDRKIRGVPQTACGVFVLFCIPWPVWYVVTFSSRLCLALSRGQTLARVAKVGAHENLIRGHYYLESEVLLGAHIAGRRRN